MLNDGFKVELYNNTLTDGGIHDITELIKSLTWSSSLSQVVGSLSLDSLDVTDEENLFIKMPPGSQIILSKFDEEIRRGVVLKTSRSSKESIAIDVVDNMFYLTKNMTTRICDNEPGVEVLKSLLEDFEIPYLNLPSLSVVIKEIFRDLTLWGIISKVLSEEERVTGDNWIARWSGQGVEFIKLGMDRPQWVLDSETTRLSGSSSQSMEKMFNRFVVRGKNDSVLKNEADSSSVMKYGQMTYQVTDEEADPTKASKMIETLKKQLNKLDESFSIECVGNPLVQSGDRIQVNDKILKTEGSFEVVSVSHSVASGFHKMNLQLRRCSYAG